MGRRGVEEEGMMEWGGEDRGRGHDGMGRKGVEGMMEWGGKE